MSICLDYDIGERVEWRAGEGAGWHPAIVVEIVHEGTAESCLTRITVDLLDLDVRRYRVCGDRIATCLRKAPQVHVQNNYDGDPAVVEAMTSERGRAVMLNVLRRNRIQECMWCGAAPAMQYQRRLEGSASFEHRFSCGAERCRSKSMAWVQQYAEWPKRGGLSLPPVDICTGCRIGNAARPGASALCPHGKRWGRMEAPTPDPELIDGLTPAECLERFRLRTVAADSQWTPKWSPEVTAAVGEFAAGRLNLTDAQLECARALWSATLRAKVAASDAARRAAETSVRYCEEDE